jgi:hypothetical protein
VTRLIPAFLPTGGQSAEVRSKAELDLRLRGIALLETMGETLTSDQADLMNANSAVVEERRPYFYPACTWEEVLDEV